MVDLELIAPNGVTLHDAALIDTGADASAFPLYWLNRLQLRKKDCRRRAFSTAGGSAYQWRYPERMRATIMGHEVELDAVFVNTPVALLGRADFMEYFEVTFDQRGGRLHARPYG
jgi:hypothetical protein